MHTLVPRARSSINTNDELFRAIILKRYATYARTDSQYGTCIKKTSCTSPTLFFLHVGFRDHHRPPSMTAPLRRRLALTLVLLFTAPYFAAAFSAGPPAAGAGTGRHAHGGYRLARAPSFLEAERPRQSPSSAATRCFSFRADATEAEAAAAAVAADASSYGGASVQERALGVLVLLTVPLSWGTYAPVVKYVYELDPPIPGFLFSAAYYSIASASLLLLAGREARGAGEGGSTSGGTGADGILGQEDPSEAASLSVQGGLELGSYLFLGNCLQVVGLETVPADRASFLVQLTTIMVPIVQATLTGGLLSISLRTWAACLLAFAGVIVMGLDGKELVLNGYKGADGTILSPLSAVLDTLSVGDLLIIAAAGAYTMHVVRLGRYAQRTTPLQLAASKASVEAIYSFVLILGLISVSNGDFGNVPSFLDETATQVSSFVSSFGDTISNAKADILIPAIGACLWTGWVTCAYTIYAQSYGQRRVSPTDANLIYTTQPIFSSLFAWVLLGETLGPAGIAGGAFIGGALLLITSDLNGGFNVADGERGS